MGEHLPYKQGVIGSSPIVPTTQKQNLLHLFSSRFYEALSKPRKGLLLRKKGQTFMREWLSGRALPCQGKCREFESRFPLHIRAIKKIPAHENPDFIGVFSYKNGGRLLSLFVDAQMRFSTFGQIRTCANAQKLKCFQKNKTYSVKTIHLFDV